MKLSNRPICESCEDMDTVVILPGQDAVAEIEKRIEGEYLLPRYLQAVKFAQAVSKTSKCRVYEYALVRYEDAVKRGIADHEGRVHRSREILHPDCLAIIEYIKSETEWGPNTPRWTSPLVLCVMPDATNAGKITPGFAITASGSLYILERLPVTIDVLAEKHPGVLKP